jgi:hypothetical protein
MAKKCAICVPFCLMCPVRIRSVQATTTKA